MNRFYYVLVMACMMFYAGVASAEHPLLDKVANKVIQKYQNSSCSQLWEERMQKQGKTVPQKEQEFVQILRNNPQLRTEFINKVAAPVANKMFECGMIP